MVSKEEIEDMYWSKGMSQREIGEIYGVNDRTISVWMREYGISARSCLESHSVNSLKPSKEKLVQMYLERDLSQFEIAIEIGVSQQTVGNWMKEYCIEPRTFSESKLKAQKPPEKVIRWMYYNKGMSQREIAKELCVSDSAVHNWMKKGDIVSRTRSETHIGEMNGNWNGGTSFEPYCSKFNNIFKESVRKRDDYICQLCGHEQKINGEKLSVHHVHYDKENCYPNVIALCRSCNSIVNSNRDEWEKYFEEQLMERGLLNWSIETEVS